MNQDFVQSSSQFSAATGIRLWLGVSLSGLVVLFLAFDAIAKLMRVTPVLEAFKKLGISTDFVVGIGLLLFVCTVLYTVPRTAILGAILLTGYLGGATAVQLIARSAAFPTCFPIGVGVLVWGGLMLRDPRLPGWILLWQ